MSGVAGSDSAREDFPVFVACVCNLQWQIVDHGLYTLSVLVRTE